MLRFVSHAACPAGERLKEIKVVVSDAKARVSFRREDTIDGSTLPHPGLKEVLLEKQANGRPTRRR